MNSRTDQVGQQDGAKRQYEQPRLTTYGSLGQITQGLNMNSPKGDGHNGNDKTN